MRPLTLTVRLAMAAAGILAPWLLLASAVVDASPPAQTPARWGHLVCDPRVPSRRALARIAFPRTTRRTVLRDVAALVKRNATKALNDDDDEAIQNDPSAVGVEEGRQMPTALEPLDILVFFPLPAPQSLDVLPSVTPRSAGLQLTCPESSHAVLGSRGTVRKADRPYLASRAAQPFLASSD